MSMTDEQQEAPQESGPSEARRLRQEMIGDDVLDRLMAATDEPGVALTGEGGFLPEMIRAVLERGMSAELTDHLGYERGDPAGRGSGNSRNGSTPKTVGTEVGDIRLDSPRDRQGCTTMLVRSGIRRPSVLASGSVASPSAKSVYLSSTHSAGAWLSGRCDAGPQLARLMSRRLMRVRNEGGLDGLIEVAGDAERERQRGKVAHQSPCGIPAQN